MPVWQSLQSLRLSSLEVTGAGGLPVSAWPVPTCSVWQLAQRLLGWEKVAVTQLLMRLSILGSAGAAAISRSCGAWSAAGSGGNGLPRLRVWVTISARAILLRSA